jgi:restriction system protein
MPVPDFQTLMLPVLREFADGAEHATKDIRQRVADRLQLTPTDIAESILHWGEVFPSDGH